MLKFQDEVSKKVVDGLQVQVSGNEQQTVEAPLSSFSAGLQPLP